MKKPLIWQPNLLKDIAPVVREDQKRAPGMEALSKSVIAKAAIKLPVELFKRGFLYRETRSSELPRIPISTRSADVDDSTTASPTLRGGKVAILAALYWKFRLFVFSPVVSTFIEFYPLNSKVNF